jgi:hypothetical protein
MNRFLTSLLLLAASVAASSSPFSVGSPLFGVRGGGLFGGSDEDKQ